MFTSDLILRGSAVVEGVTLRWWVTDGLRQWLTVSHQTGGTQTRRLVQSPESQAREIGREMLARSKRLTADVRVLALEKLAPDR
jgi:hypothetical protein